MARLGASGRRPAVQAVRTAVFAVLATVLALGAHVAAGGAPPAAGPVLLAVLVTATAGSLLGSRAPSLPRAVLTLGGVQALAHHLFMTAPADGGHPMPHGVARTGLSPGMLAAHAVVVLVTAWMLVRGERAVAALLARAAVRLPGALPQLTPEAALRPVPCAVLVPAHGRVVISHLLLRGPPEGALAVR